MHQDVGDVVDIRGRSVPFLSDVLYVVSRDHWERTELRVHRLRAKRGGGIWALPLSETNRGAGASDGVEVDE